MKTCSVEGCPSRHYGRGFCRSHWKKFKAHGTPTPVPPTAKERFWPKVNKTESCWIWTASIDNNGYGKFRADGRSWMAHRLSYSWSVSGGVPDGMFIDHICHNRACVNPEHLRPVTNKQNIENFGGMRADNTSGARGVYWSKQKRAWHATVAHNSKTFHAGFFSNVKDAAEAAKALRIQLFTHNDLDRVAA